MKGFTFLAILVLVLFIHSVQPVYVQIGNFSLPLEDVKQLKAFWSLDTNGNARPKRNIGALCANPELPVEYQHICLREDAPKIFSQLLNMDAQAMELCEICVNAACAGC
ncbi:PREDICTED: guanylate cyclase activator 2B-like [Crocodylus porosus]|uniref:guanylate cyclase activator 2B-like n=1 Tax=Crocodylus porosus TaxID=8502 RepID=UPI00093D00B7|nr:PREDICTED: guanylate cyclase activator 2B-like [Crocodylus porosus]